MNRGIRALGAAFCCVLLFTLTPLTSLAKELEPCYHCNKTGQFHCSVCNNTGEVTCEGCRGEGGRVCPGEPGKGCDGGYYTCPSCGGDTYVRSGDGQIPADAQPGSCGACGGSGKMRCVVCHTVPGWNVCEGCNGTGKQECMAPNCRDSKKVGWKCHYCMGAAYLLVGNPMPPASANDGVKNQPVKGDHIITNNKTWEYYVYTGSGGATPTGSGQTAPVTRAPTKPEPTKGTEPTVLPTDPIPTKTEPVPTKTEPVPTETEPIPTETGPAEETRILDCGEGRFEMEGMRPVFVWMDGHTVSGEVEVGMDTPIRLEDLVPECMHVFLKGEEGFSVQLRPDKDGYVSLSRRQPPEVEIPRRVRLTVEFFNDEVPPEPTEAAPPIIDRDEPGGGLPLILGVGAGVLALIAVFIFILKKRKTGAKI